MANNKVQLSDGTVLLDLTGDTVTPETLAAGVTAHDAAGEQIVGEATSGGMTQEEADARYLKLSGGTMTGTLTLHNHPEEYDGTSDEGVACIMADMETLGREKFPLIGVSVENDCLFLFDYPGTQSAGDGLGNKGNFVRVDCAGVAFENVGSTLRTSIPETDFYLLTANDVKDAVMPKSVSAVLTASGWGADKKQTVTVSGVLADATKQLITITQLTETAVIAYHDAGILRVAQAANKVTFRCDTVPATDIPVSVVMIPINGGRL